MGFKLNKVKTVFLGALTFAVLLPACEKAKLSHHGDRPDTPVARTNNTPVTQRQITPPPVRPQQPSTPRVTVDLGDDGDVFTDLDDTEAQVFDFLRRRKKPPVIVDKGGDEEDKDTFVKGSFYKRFEHADRTCRCFNCDEVTITKRVGRYTPCETEIQCETIEKDIIVDRGSQGKNLDLDGGDLGGQDLSRKDFNDGDKEDQCERDSQLSRKGKNCYRCKTRETVVERDSRQLNILFVVSTSPQRGNKHVTESWLEKRREVARGSEFLFRHLKQNGVRVKTAVLPAYTGPKSGRIFRDRVLNLQNTTPASMSHQLEALMTEIPDDQKSGNAGVYALNQALQPGSQNLQRLQTRGFFVGQNFSHDLIIFVTNDSDVCYTHCESSSEKFEHLSCGPRFRRADILHSFKNLFRVKPFFIGIMRGYENEQTGELNIKAVQSGGYAELMAKFGFHKTQFYIPARPSKSVRADGSTGIASSPGYYGQELIKAVNSLEHRTRFSLSRPQGVRANNPFSILLSSIRTTLNGRRVKSRYDHKSHSVSFDQKHAIPSGNPVDIDYTYYKGECEEPSSGLKK